jgi:hypothetical protein
VITIKMKKISKIYIYKIMGKTFLTIISFLERSPPLSPSITIIF